MGTCEFKMTATGRVKYTITKDGNIRIKISEKHEQDKNKYEMIGQFIAAQLGPIEKTMRGVLQPNWPIISMFNDSMKEKREIDLTECIGCLVPYQGRTVNPIMRSEITVVSNPFGVEVGEYYKYHRPGWVYASIVKVEENANDAYGMQVRDIEYQGAYELRPSKLSDYPADGIFEIIFIRLKPNSRVSSPVTVSGSDCKSDGSVPSRFKS